MDNMIGKITVICGPMFSGKTEELIRLIKRIKIAKKECIVFKPKTDNRYNARMVCSHDGNKIECHIVDKAIDIIKYLDKHPTIKYIGIDEAQFFDNALYDVVKHLADNGYYIVVAGLDMNFRQEPFGAMPQLLAIANEVRKLTAVCSVCGKDAQYNQRMINGKPASYNDPEIVVGGQDCYDAKCREHFVMDDKPKLKIEVKK